MATGYSNRQPLRRNTDCFQMFPCLVLILKTEFIKNVSFQNIRFHQQDSKRSMSLAEQCELKTETDKFCSVFHMKMEQCETGLGVNFETWSKVCPNYFIYHYFGIILISCRENQRNTGRLKEQKNMEIFRSHSCLLKNFLNMSFQHSR